jgi:hypothetical protein
MADTEEVVFEFTAPGRVHEVVDHAGRLPGSGPGRFSIHSSQGRSANTTPDPPSANYAPNNASDQAS